MDIKAYLNQKKVAKTALTRLKNKTTDELDSLDSAKLNVIRNRFSDIGEELKAIFSNIFGLCKDDEIEKYSNEREELFETLDEMLATIDRINMKGNEKKNEINNVTSNSNYNEIKLPTLSLPTFSGTVDEWLTFSDLFKAAVIDNQKLSGAQKLQYLKGVLKNDAQKIVQSLSITDDNFKIAWDLLTERYFHKREILGSLMKKLLNMPQLNNESHSQILNLVDSTKEYVRLLETLDLKIDETADTMLLFIVQFKLDPATRSWWERSLKNDQIPKLNELLEFLSNHARSIVSGNQGVKKNFSKNVTLLASGFQTQCIFCKGAHTLNKCDSFLKLSVNKRVNFVRSNNVCFNCLTPFHRKSNCKSTARCQKCKQSHHTLLHFDNKVESGSDRDQLVTNSANASLSAAAKVFQPAVPLGSNRDSNSVSEVGRNSGITSCCSDFGSDAQVLLCTAIVSVNDSEGKVQLCRALLDPGSQACLITNDCLKRLGLPKKRANVLISCLGSADTYTNGVSQITFSPHFPSNSYFSTSVYVVQKIVGKLPHVSLDSSWSEPFSDLKLADPTFYKSAAVDILLGVNIALPLLKGQMLSSGEGKPFAVRSDLGWIIAGNVNAPEAPDAPVINVNNIQLVNDQIIQKFWELDTVPAANLLTTAEKACEEHFVKTHTRDETGRYIVKLPFHSSPSQLGDSRQSALRRLNYLEKSLASKPVKYEQYRKFMKDYLELGHMELVPQSDYAKRDAYYLPHHAVLRESSSTTKLRVVFDASCPSSSGISLNDLLMIGPRVQQDLYPILIRFRTFLVAVCADVEKMFRQVKVHRDDIDWQRILWRNAPEDPVLEFKLLTVTYGTACAPFLSTRAMQQLALDEKSNYPLASHATLNDFYVDDLLSGAASEEEAVELVEQLKKMMKKGGFNLRKWRSNISTIVEELSDEQQMIPVDSEDDVKVLGISWNPKIDSFSFSVLPMEEKKENSKREILSEVSRMFDPLGLISPCVVFMKILLQELWKHKLTWDEPIPEDLNKLWISFRKELHLINQIKIPRCVLNPMCVNIELHAFCDASEKAYCAVVYVRCILSNSDIYVSLLTSKTRVAPLKTQSLPRLELCAALLLADVLQVVLRDINLPIQNTLAWTDSTITLAWLLTEPYRWQPFVANRVSKIQTTIPSVKWYHVPGTCNPADLGTRGLLPSQLVNNDLWLHGPDWLSQPLKEQAEFDINDASSLSDNFRKEERKFTATTCATKMVSLPEFIAKISSFSKLIRVCAWILRFLSNSRPGASRISGWLTSKELDRAIIRIVNLIQKFEFSSELNYLVKGKPLPRESKLLPLNVFLDSNGIIRVGGRLANHSNLNYDQKHPMLLPKNHEFTTKLILYYHVTNLHAGPQLTLSLIRQKFWFVDGRSTVRKQIRNCIKCLQWNLRASPQLMGDLPSTRIMQIRVFDIVGLDYAGPIYTKCAHKRSVAKFKSYICLFICTATKAIHLELVSELSTACFLASLRRFISRRGCPSKIISDNGSNFKGAARHLKELALLCREEKVQNFCSMKGIEWSFIPPYTPHFGGLWEAAVKSAKQMLTKVSNSALLSFEEVYTLLLQIEACLNSRPLTALSSDPSDLNALTPAHFLVGGPIHQFPEPVQPTKNLCLSERWRLIQKLRQQFWDRWSKEYLHQLQPRSKWWKSIPNLKIGDLVLVHMNNSAPLQWTLGRITELFPGLDKKVRVVTIKTKYGHVKRSMNKVYLLPM